MPKRKSPADYEADPAEALAQAQGQRYASRADYENLLNERENHILGLSEKSGPKSDRFLNARKDLEKAEREFERIHAVVRRPLNRWAFPPRVFLLLALLLAAFEAPVNKFLFDAALESTNLASIGISFGFACGLLFLAHVAGLSLRQIWSEHRKRVVWTSVVLFLLMLAVLFALVSILTVARATFSAEAGTIRDLLSDVGSTIRQAGIFGALARAMSDMSALVLATVNIGGIFMTMMLSFFMHDADKDFDQASRTVERQRRKLSEIVDEFTTSKNKIVKEYAPHLAGHSANYKTANMTVIALKKRLGQEFEDEDHIVIDKLDTLAEDSAHYPDVQKVTAEIRPVRQPGPGTGPGPVLSGGARREPKFAAGERNDG